MAPGPGRSGRAPAAGCRERTVEAVEPLCFAYRQLLEALTEDHDVIAFPYDWRRSVVEAGDRLRTLLTELLAASDGDGPPDPPRRALVGRPGDPPHAERRPIATCRLSSSIAVVGSCSSGRRTAGRSRRLWPSAASTRRSASSPRSTSARTWTTCSTSCGPSGVCSSCSLTPGSTRARRRASFLYDPQLWGKRLESVEALRAELDAAGDRHEALSLDGSGIDLIVGDGMPTPTAARRSPTLGFEIEVSSAGDGTVAHVCSDLENVRTWFATGVSHGNLVKDARTVRALRDILVRGSTDLLRVTPSQLGRGGTTPEGGRWYSPAEAALVVDDSAAARMSVGEPPWTRRDAAVRMVDGMVAVAGQAPPSRDQLEVSVRHGDLQCADYPLLLGHAAGTPLAGAEGRCDALLGGALTKLQEPGPLPGRRVDVPVHPERQPRGSPGRVPRAGPGSVRGAHEEHLGRPRAAGRDRLREPVQQQRRHGGHGAIAVGRTRRHRAGVRAARRGLDRRHLRRGARGQRRAARQRSADDRPPPDHRLLRGKGREVL